MIKRVEKETGLDGSILTWAFPGGKQRFNESREECVKREILAETGYDVRPTQQISIRLHPQFFVTIVYHLCYLNDEKPVAEPTEPHEVAEVKWIKTEEIKNFITTDLDPAVKKVLDLK